MADLQLDSISLRLEYAVKADEGVGVDIDPYEMSTELSLSNAIFFTDEIDDVPGDPILGLQTVENGHPKYVLFRLQDNFEFEFDTDDQLSPLGGALKISFTNVDEGTGASVVDTAYFPFDATIHDIRVDTLPTDVKFRIVINQETVAADPSHPKYHLVRFDNDSADVVSCEDRCNQISNPKRRRQCLLGCE
jgi:hypothetical protein